MGFGLPRAKLRNPNIYLGLKDTQSGDGGNRTRASSLESLVFCLRTPPPLRSCCLLQMFFGCPGALHVPCIMCQCSRGIRMDPVGIEPTTSSPPAPDGAQRQERKRSTKLSYGSPWGTTGLEPATCGFLGRCSAD
jgi:hypothetical protein